MAFQSKTQALSIQIIMKHSNRVTSLRLRDLAASLRNSEMMRDFGELIGISFSKASMQVLDFEEAGKDRDGSVERGNLEEASCIEGRNFFEEYATLYRKRQGLRAFAGSERGSGKRWFVLW